MQEVKKAFESYSKRMKKLDDFRQEHNKILVDHFRLEEEARIAEFTAREKIDMWIDEGKIKEDILLENDLLELRVKPAKKVIQFFFKKFYDPNNKLKELKDAQESKNRENEEQENLRESGDSNREQ